MFTFKTIESEKKNQSSKLFKIALKIENAILSVLYYYKTVQYKTELKYFHFLSF